MFLSSREPCCCPEYSDLDLLHAEIHVCASNSLLKTISRYLDSLGSGVGGAPPPLSRSRDDSLNSSDSEYAGGASDVEERRRSRTKVVLLNCCALIYVLFSNPRSIIASYQNDILLLNDLCFVFNKNFNLLVSGELKAPGGEAEHDPRGMQQAERRV